MNYHGIIIEESLKNKDILKDIQILETNVEQVTSRHRTPWLSQWTLHTVEIPEDTADLLAEKIRKNIETSHSAWYADYKNNLLHYIIFPEKIYKVDIKNPVLYKDAREYGISLGIPEYQVNFGS